MQLVFVCVCVFHQRVQYNEMAINQCQTGVDDEMEIPQEIFSQERFRHGKQGVNQLYNILVQVTTGVF